MTLFVGDTGSPKRRRASQAVGFAVVTIAAVAFVGWWAGLPLLSSWGSGFATMKPTAGAAARREAAEAALRESEATFPCHVRLQQRRQG